MRLRPELIKVEKIKEEDEVSSFHLGNESSSHMSRFDFQTCYSGTENSRQSSRKKIFNVQGEFGNIKKGSSELENAETVKEGGNSSKKENHNSSNLPLRRRKLF